MRHLLIVAAFAATLAGCASEPMTDEQRQMAFQYLMAQQNRPPPPQPQPYYVPVNPAPVNPSVNCISNHVGNQTYTNCN
jgi:PBP1b-binding outer membrane lipoprotein LpoB